MPTVDKIVVELDAKINAYQSKIAKATVSYKTYGNTVQKTSKQAQSFMEKSQNGQALATERTARAIQRAQLLNSKNVRQSAQEQVNAIEEATDKIIGFLDKQKLAQKASLSVAEKVGKLKEKAFLPLKAAELGAGIFKGVKSALELASETKVLAESAGLTTEKFTEATFAAQRYGVQQEQLAGIFKDVSGHIGDLVLNNAGPLKDFLDNTGHAAGLTAESFIGLGSDEVLGLVAKTMEESGQSGQQLTNVLESLGADAVRLKPLLANNSKEFRELAAEAQAVGVVLDSDTAAAAFSANAELDRLGLTLKTGIRNAVIEAAPQIEAVTEKIIDFIPRLLEWAATAAGVLENFVDFLDRLNQDDIEFVESLPDSDNIKIYQENLDASIRLI